MARGALDIIAQIMEDPRVKQGRRFPGGRFTSQVYEDEPILKTGRQMETHLPPEYLAVRDLARTGEARVRSRAWLFREQGLLLADLTDDRPYHGNFEVYYPTYQSMNDRQLRGYITWRTSVRRGETPAAPTSFMFVYVYELLNGIGVRTPEEGYRALRRFWLAYREQEPLLDRYVRRWLWDYVVYYGLDRSLIAHDEKLSSALERDAQLLQVLHPEGRTDEEIFDALSSLATYHIAKSRFYRDFPDDVRAVSLSVLQQLDRYYAKNRKRGLTESLFGTDSALPYEMFGAAVFYEPTRHADTVYEFDPIRRFTCSHGMWTCERYACGPAGNSRLGTILKTVDAQMRARYEYAYPLKEFKTPKYLAQIIDTEIDRRLAWNEAHTPRTIEIDRSKLQGIRSRAAETCEELLVDEERAEIGVPVMVEADGWTAAEAAPEERPFAAPAAQAASAQAPQPEPLASVLLDPAESALLGRLLAGEDYADVLADTPLTLEMLVDAINEKLFDLLGDTALEFNGERPEVIEDYREDLRGVAAP